MSAFESQTLVYYINYLQLALCSQVNACLAFRMYILITSRFEHHLSAETANLETLARFE